MGSPKALLPLGGGTFLTVILETLDQVDLGLPIIVLGKQASDILPIIPRERVIVLINPDPDRGQLSSMKLAIEQTPQKTSACLFWPVDHPLVSVDLVQGLVELFLRTQAPIVLPRSGSQRGHPAIFNRSLFRELLDLPWEEGAKSLVEKYKEQIAFLPTEERAAIEDIDTPEDYSKLIH